MHDLGAVIQLGEESRDRFVIYIASKQQLAYDSVESTDDADEKGAS